MDVNKDGYISHEDYKLMSNRLAAETSGMTKEQVDAIYKVFMHAADVIGLKQGVKTPVEEVAKSASKAILSTTLEEKKDLFHSTNETYRLT